MTTRLLAQKLEPVTNRDPKYLETDKSAVRAIAQAAINVELFTIPLYMVALYSIQGTHPINTKNISYYKGRVWPGSATTAYPKTANEKAFNIVFSVFIEEMLHLQMAANLAKAIGVQPNFTSSLLQKEDRGWICYGDDKTAIPHVVDLKDTQNYRDVQVKLDSLNKKQIDLFLAIEQTLEDARNNILPKKAEDYFPAVPFKNWTPEKTEIDLPMFGSIGWLYQCYAMYLSIKYSDGESLWDKILKEECEEWKQKTPTEDFILQKDMFNYRNSGHPAVEFPCFATELAIKLKQKEDGKLDKKEIDLAFDEAIEMMIAITDQGEGSTLDLEGIETDNAPGSKKTIGLSQWKRITPSRPEAVKVSAAGKSKCPAHIKAKYQAYKESLKCNYPAYTDTGKPAPSRDAKARYSNSEKTHYKRFEEVQRLLGNVVTWDTWHKNPQNIWTAKMLTTKDYNADTAPKNIPIPDDIAGALNRLKNNDKDGNNYRLVSQAAVGAIAGITTILDNYWQNPTVDFPYPSMVGSGDRVSIGWAIFGKVPDLSLDIGKQYPDKLYHACQGLDIEHPHDTSEAPVEVFHSCRGSNVCKAQGGCGFAQLDQGGGSCRAMRVAYPTVLKGGEVLCGSPKPTDQFYSSPADNKCRGLGGCAVPISASQLFPRGGEMKIYNFEGDKHNSKQIGSMPFQLGDNVYEKAWEAYSQVMAARGQEPGEKPLPSDLRLAFPPST